MLLRVCPLGRLRPLASVDFLLVQWSVLFLTFGAFSVLFLAVGCPLVVRCVVPASMYHCSHTVCAQITPHNSRADPEVPQSRPVRTDSVDSWTGSSLLPAPPLPLPTCHTGSLLPATLSALPPLATRECKSFGLSGFPSSEPAYTQSPLGARVTAPSALRVAPRSSQKAARPSSTPSKASTGLARSSPGVLVP